MLCVYMYAYDFCYHENILKQCFSFIVQIFLNFHFVQAKDISEDIAVNKIVLDAILDASW